MISIKGISFFFNVNYKELKIVFIISNCIITKFDKITNATNFVSICYSIAEGSETY